MNARHIGDIAVTPSVFLYKLSSHTQSGSIPLTNGSGSGRPKKTCGSGGSGTLISCFANLKSGDILSLEEGGMNVG
jgi:hypothetical protein